MKTRTVTALTFAALASTVLIISLPGRDLSEVSPSTQKPPAQTVPPALPLGERPLPKPNPDITNSIPRINQKKDIAALKRGLDRLSSRDVLAAMAIRDELKRSSLDGQLLSWAIALSGQSAVPASELRQTLDSKLPLPGNVTIASNYERALIRESQNPAQLIEYFSSEAPQTIEGKLSFANGLNVSGKVDQARAIISTLWHQENLNAASEAEILSTFSHFLSQEDHRKRFFMLAYKGRLGSAKEVSALAGTSQLFTAWTAVENRQKDAGTKIAAARKEWPNEPAVTYIELRQKRMAWDYAGAAKLLERISPQDIQATSPSAWWNEMRIVARGLMDQGSFKRAYELIAAHPAVDNDEALDAEFHAGWIALRYLSDSKLAEPHFRKMVTLAKTPISLSKAHYWLAQSVKDAGNDAYKQHMQLAADQPTSFYGQLASERLGQAELKIEEPEILDEDRIMLAGRPLMHAIERLEAAGYSWRSDILYRTLAAELSRPGELAVLTKRLEARGAHQVSLNIGRAALNRGVDQAALAFPVSAIPQDAKIGATGKALAFAIARQESSFDVAAISPANAQGLLQILPGTAKEVAARLNINFEPSKLTSDAAYNAQLGSHYLSEQITKFDGSYILTFIAYNAGPRRVDEWIKRYGDPRKLSIDGVIDWIERIPYPETRNYVQRVMENYQVYKVRLGEDAHIEIDLTKGRQ